MNDVKIKDMFDGEDSLKDADCLLCQYHDIAKERLDSTIKCPKCGFEHLEARCKYQVIGEDNSRNPDSKIGKYNTFNCHACGEYIALMPHSVIYNANHDVYYTGGKSYINDNELDALIESFRNKIITSLNQAFERIKNGEQTISSSNVYQWIKYDLEEGIASYLYSKGIKR